MDHSRVPVLEALQEFRRRGDVVFGPPAHGQGRGADPRVVEVVGAGVFASDVLMLNGLDDRRQSQGVLAQAQALMADAVGAEHAFFSTCGSSLSVKSAMISVAGPGEKLLVSRNAHKSVIAALVISGIDPVWVHPHFDDDLHLAHPPEPDDVRAALQANPDARGMLLISPTDWGTCADIAGVAEVCHEYDVPLLVDEAWGAMLPRDAFFAATEQVPVAEAIGRVAAEMVSPYPPGVPVLSPGEVVRAETVEYLTTGVAAGMLVPDAADPALGSLRVVAGPQRPPGS
ncbi:aminotransferase class I/II-fold pyridoxal phosphate-dependent enzyme [Promicromonospora sp. NPDC019610]|uniref:aminotransferase class I/II-fold pyridoxal phosphate-dependent enzyme n=1 Tax=Promicromonospora sp. NPDC019610 TaxID=3364405 RepID=UPI0037A5F34D